jgi:hypothetical protein
MVQKQHNPSGGSPWTEDIILFKQEVVSMPTSGVYSDDNDDFPLELFTAFARRLALLFS